jgi:ArsR family transcriptional regulator
MGFAVLSSSYALFLIQPSHAEMLRGTSLYIGFFRYIYRLMTIQAAQTTELDEVLKALSNPVRRQILCWMKEPERNFPGQDHPYEFGICAGKIGDACDLSQSTVSAHLATLQHAGLIIPRRVGQWVFYKRNESAISAFLSRMEQTL